MADKEKEPKPNPNLEIWEQSDKPPTSALKQIKGGRISGKTDINPQWRYHKLTELFGVCGKGWWTVETSREFVPCGEEIAVFVDVDLHIKGFDHPVHGSGGNVFRVAEKNGLRLNDEAIKMATTDAISVCCKQLGIGSAIYEGKWNGSKYADDAPNPQPQKRGTQKPVAQTPPPQQKPKDPHFVSIVFRDPALGGIVQAYMGLHNINTDDAGKARMRELLQKIWRQCGGLETMKAPSQAVKDKYAKAIKEKLTADNTPDMVMGKEEEDENLPF